jgi:hypothetical protein
MLLLEASRAAEDGAVGLLLLDDLQAVDGLRIG